MIHRRTDDSDAVSPLSADSRELIVETVTSSASCATM